MFDPSCEERIAHYLSRTGGQVKRTRFLGEGTDGAVWESSRSTAIKALRMPTGYFNERDSYLRLAEYGVTVKLNGFWIPKLVGYDDALLIVEMDLMQNPPYIIDFAKVRIDRPPDFTEEQLEYHRREGMEWFGDHWPEVQ